MSTDQFAGRRKQLIDVLRGKGIADENVLRAIDSTPRELFIDERMWGIAYDDRALPIDKNQTISQPYTVAFQTQLLSVTEGMKVLEIGTGSGYQAVILAHMGATVFTIERQSVLFEKNRQFAYLNSFPNIHRYFGDGFKGIPQHAPYDRIIITAAAPNLPAAVLQQLKPGGMLVVPLRAGKSETMTRILTLPDGRSIQESYGTFSFVPMLRGLN